MDRELKLIEGGKLEIIGCMGNDTTIVQNARMSTKSQKLSDKEIIEFMMKQEVPHNVPFEHVVFSFLCEVSFVCQDSVVHEENSILSAYASQKHLN